jgi:purine catabolism regulator
MTCGIGAFHADILEGPASVEEARHSLSLGRRLHGRGSVTLYADLGVYALLHAGAEREAFVRFAESQIAPLDGYDRKHKTDLLKTLRLYFDIGENVKEAAERLSVHRHTIFYRLNQISQILKVDLRLPRDQLSLRTALAIWQMEHDEE